MLSTELPITDWWDPEWEVYDVPISPDNVPHDVWWPAYFHQAMIEYITTGRTWGWPDGILTRQLTAGPASVPYLGAWPWPCSCEYVVDGAWHLPAVTRALSGVGFGEAQSAIATWFVIHSDCPQHGDDAHA